MGQFKRLCIFSFFLIFNLCGCDRRQGPEAPVILIAIENLSTQDLPCGGDSHAGPLNGLDLLCRDAARVGPFRPSGAGSHADLATFLFQASAQALQINKSNSYVRAEFESVAERAFHASRDTAFFGSSPFFLRKSGLSQGFSHFEESSQIETQRWGRRADAVVTSFLRWAPSSPFYAVLTFSDLQFPWARTQTLEGQERERSLETQLDFVSEQLGVLFKTLQERQLYQKSWIFVFGVSGRVENGRRLGLAGFVKPPQSVTAPEYESTTPTLGEYSQIFHAAALRTTLNFLTDQESELTSSGFQKSSEVSWVIPQKSDFRAKALMSRWLENSELRPWLQLEYLESNRSKEFLEVAKKGGPPDSKSFWERALLNRRNQSLVDPCLRMVDLKIFEGGGAKTCDSQTLLALQEWMRQAESGSDEARIREARMKTVRHLHELRSVRRAHMINYALGEPFELPPEIGNEILKVEMALRLPDQVATKTWLDQAEPTLTDPTD